MPKPCILCGGEEFHLWDTHNGIDVIVCNACGMGRAEMPAAVEHPAETYDAEYFTAMSYDRKWRFRVRRATRWLQYIAELKRPPGALLDIGCAMGYYLDAAKRLGWTAYGADISDHALEETRRRGYEAFWSTHPDDFPDWLPPLDVVTAAQVIEHFENPIGYLRALKGRMNPGGVIYAQLPNFQKLLDQGPEVPYMGPPEHLYYFTLETARSAFEKAGWQLLSPPRLRPRAIGWKLHLWVPELLWQFPREIIREKYTLNGKLTNMHLFATVGE